RKQSRRHGGWETDRRRPDTTRIEQPMTHHNIVGSALCGVVLLFASWPTPAHHSGVMFDFTAPQKVTGTVRNFEWTNPHVWLWIIVVDDKGASALYAFEGTSPGEMSRRS